MFRSFSLTIFRLINEKLSKQLHLTCVGCIQWGGKRWSGYECSCLLSFSFINLKMVIEKGRNM